MVPAMAVPVSEDEMLESEEDLDMVTLRLRFWKERNGVGSVVGLHLLRFLGVLMIKILGLSMYIVAKVPAITNFSGVMI